VTDTMLAGASEAPAPLVPRITKVRGRAFGSMVSDRWAHRLLARHPEIRSVELVGWLVAVARSGKHPAWRSKRALRRAALLCGPDWPDGPELISDLLAADDVLAEAELDRVDLDRLVEQARRASDPDLAPVVPPGLRGGLLAAAALVLARAWERTGDLRLLDEARAAQLGAVESTHPESPIAPFRMNALAVWSVEKFKVTGRRALLDSALTIQRHGVESHPRNRWALAHLLDGLARSLGVLYSVTRQTDVIEEAVTCQRRAVSLLETSDDEAPDPVVDAYAGFLRREHLRILSRLAELLAAQYCTRRDPELLEEAVGIQRRVVEGTSEGAEPLPQYLGRLAVLLRVQHEASGDRRLLEEAVTTQRRALAALPADHVDRPPFVCRLAEIVTDLSDATGDSELVDDAWAMVEHLHAHRPSEDATLGWSRAQLVRRGRRRDRFAVAAREAAAATEAVERLGRAEPTPDRRLDLAQQFDGLLGDLVASMVRSGDVERAVERVEAERVWLGAPARRATEAARTLPPVPVAWVASSRWETVVVTTVDHRRYAAHVVERTRDDIHQAVMTSMVAAESPAPETSEGRARWMATRQQAVDRLCSLATEIAATFPREESLLLVPVGWAALLPYAAARRGDRFLTDEARLTVSPSLTWARAAHRPRPGGPSVGAFHPGAPSDDPRDLDHARQAFGTLVDATILDRPSAEEVLTRFVGADVAHLKCRFAFSPNDPLESRLHLETHLTMRAVLEHPPAPWLVNISANASAVCHPRAAEQQLSFPTAFVLSGAAHVLATVWPTNPPNRTMFDTAFYRYLAEGLHPADARRRAVRQLRDTLSMPDGTDLHPLHWAPFTHVGSPW
jgi:hypothetical protein